MTLLAGDGEIVVEAGVGADGLVIDDNSPDGTGTDVDELVAQNAQIRVIHREGKLGLGTATVAGFQYGIQHGFDYLLNMDADFSHPPRFLPSLIEAVQSGNIKGGFLESATVLSKTKNAVEIVNKPMDKKKVTWKNNEFDNSDFQLTNHR